MADNLSRAYKSMIENPAISTNPGDTDVLRQKLTNDYLRDIKMNRVMAPLAQMTDLLSSSYTGAPAGRAPTPTISGAFNPDQSIGNMLGWLGKQETSGMTDYQKEMIRLKEKQLGQKSAEGEGMSDFEWKQVTKLSEATGDAAAIVTNFDSLQKLIPDLFDDKATTPIPGVGELRNIQPLTTMGQKGAAIRQRATSLVRAYIYLRSGKQINQQEANDFMKIAGMGWDAPASAFRSGMTGLNNEIRQLIKNKEAGFSPKVKSVFASQGGITSDMIPKVKGKGTSLDTAFGAFSEEKGWNGAPLESQPEGEQSVSGGESKRPPLSSFNR